MPQFRGDTMKKRLLVFFGMIATGKSHLASAFAKKWGCAYYNSDVVRKELAGLSSHKRELAAIDTGIYSSDFSRRTYDALLSRAQRDLAQDKYRCAVLDGSYQRRSERERLCGTLGAEHRLVFIFCRCSEAVMKQRMDRRLKNPRAVSDGRWEIYLEQKQRFEMPLELPEEQLLTVDTDRPLPELLSYLEEGLGGMED
jgi:uncharacterized protein